MTAPQRGPAPTISLVVVNHRSASLTQRLVDAVAGEVDEVVIVDNPADEDPGRRGVTALDAVATRHGNVRVVPLQRNVGYGSGANAGAAATHGDVLVVANADVQVDARSLRILAACAYRAGIAGPRFERPDGTLERSAHRREPGLGITAYDLCPPVSGLLRRIRPGWHPTLFAGADHDRPLECSHLLGALLAVDADAFRAVGGFDEAFFLYREETDLCRRLRNAGWRVRYEPAAGAVHIGGASTDGTWPMPARPVVLESHYRYIAKHRGRVVAGLARSLGTLGSLLWLARLRDRRAALRSVRWHLGARRNAAPEEPVAPGEPGPVTGRPVGP